MDITPIVLIIFGIIFWCYSIHLVNEEILNYQILNKDKDATIYSVDLKGPDWQVLRAMSEKRVWVVLAIILAPLLVIAWGITIIGAFLFILLPQEIWEGTQDVWWSIKKASRR